MTTTIPTEYGPIVGTIHYGTYPDGSLAVQIASDDGIDTLSVNLIAYGMVAPAGHFHAKSDYADGIEQSGLAVKVAPVTYGPFNSTGYLMAVQCHAARTGEGYWTCDVPGGCPDCRVLAAELNDPVFKETS